LAGGLWAGAAARLVRGAPFVCGLAGFDGRARRAAVVITGEGRLDATTLEGKVVAEVAARCRRLGVPADAVVGEDAADPGTQRALGLESVVEAGDANSITVAAERLAEAQAGA
jgi:glycerate kinase